MAHYAFIDENSIVVEVITGRNEDEIIDGISDWEKHYEEFRPGLTCIRTSYNGNIRKNFAGVGYTFDGIGFAAPQPYPSWTKNAESYLWEAPVAKPTDDKEYEWDEATTSWVELSV